MTSASYKVKVPGKLFIAGEYAILEHDQQAIVVAVERYINVEISDSIDNQLALPQLGFDDLTWEISEGEIEFNRTDPKLIFIKNTIRLFNQFLQEQSVRQRPFSMKITSELDDPSGRKYGLGSSGAVVVAVVTALLCLYENNTIKPLPEVIYKLSAIIHFQTQGNGSCADIAASTYGGWINYSAFQSEWLISELQNGKNVSSLLMESWPSLRIQPINPPPSLHLCVGWTGNEAATAPMVNEIKKLRRENATFYKQFLQESQSAVENLITSFNKNDHRGAITSLAQNREVLKRLGETAGVSIETFKLNTLITIAEKYGSGKSSGAGGGDCGIAFVSSDDQVRKLYDDWRVAQILPLHLHVSQQGATIEK